MIDDIQSPKKAFKDDEEHCEGLTTFEVQYGLIDLNWVNILNIFDQQPIHKCLKRQKQSTKKTKKNTHWEFNWHDEIKRHQEKKLPLIAFIDAEKNLDIFKYQSIKLMIDHYWNNQSCDYFKTQFLIYLLFFILPFAVDLYYLILVTIPYRDIASA